MLLIIRLEMVSNQQENIYSQGCFQLNIVSPQGQLMFL